jgi:serine/threonine protein phosphatase PrpC
MGSGSTQPPPFHGSALDLGNRATQQDFTLSLPNYFTRSSKVYHVFGIFDGHGSTT